ncbi:hypothetical protein V1226_09420 [Lachnospiraceae bacterium JLR.KK009]|nr:hypothetical protein C810_01692 [Lachnospiraceae bacterium A2]
MAKHVRNMNELQKALQPTMIKMVDKLAQRVYETLNYFISDYYTGWTPESYRRTEAFLRSAVKVDAYPDKGGVKASVYIDYNSMDDYVNATGYQVAQWANSGLHGGLSVSHKPRVWDDTVDETINNGSLLQLAVQYLRSQGISVRS